MARLQLVKGSMASYEVRHSSGSTGPDEAATPPGGWRFASYAAVAGVVLLALVFRLQAAWAWNARHPNSRERLRYGDEPSYDATARYLLEGLGFPFPDRLPLYPSWVAFWHRLTDFDYAALIYAQVAIGMASVLLVYLLARRLGGSVAALLAALAAGVSVTLISQGLRVAPEVMFTAAVLGVALLLYRAWHAPSVASFAMAGLSVGMANLIRPTLLFLPVFIAGAVVIRGRGSRTSMKWAVSMAAVAYLVTAPWTLHNYIRHGAFLPLSTSNATLWLGSPEYHRLIHDQGYTYFRVWDEIIYPDDDVSVPHPTTIEGERYWSERAMRSIRSDPALYARLVIERLGTYWVGDPVVDWGQTRVFSYWHLREGRSPSAAARLLIERTIPIFALLAVVVLRRRWRELLPLYLLLLYTTLLHAATVARIRMSEPFYPLLMALIATAVVHLAGAFRKKPGAD